MRSRGLVADQPPRRSIFRGSEMADNSHFKLGSDAPSGNTSAGGNKSAENKMSGSESDSLSNLPSDRKTGSSSGRKSSKRKPSGDTSACGSGTTEPQERLILRNGPEKGSGLFDYTADDQRQFRPAPVSTAAYPTAQAAPHMVKKPNPPGTAQIHDQSIQRGLGGEMHQIAAPDGEVLTTALGVPICFSAQVKSPRCLCAFQRLRAPKAPL